MGLELINELKKQKKMTSEELARQSGVPLGTLNKILNGSTKDPKIETFRALCPVLGCTLDDLAETEEESVEGLLRKLAKKKPHTAVLMGSGGDGGQEVREISQEKYQKILKMLEIIDDEESRK